MGPEYTRDDVETWDDGFQELKWKKLSNLVPLVKSLPKDAWAEKISNEDERLYIILTRPLRVEDVRLCKKFARWINTLGNYSEPGSQIQTDGCALDDYSESRFCELHLTVYDALKTLGVLPLPNLQTYYVQTPVQIITLNSVAGPKITSIKFASMSHTTENSSSPVLLEDVSFSPNLPSSHLGIETNGYCFPTAVVMSTSIAHCLQDMKNLQAISLHDCGVLKKDDFRTLLSIESLLELELGMMKEEFLPFVPSLTCQRLKHLQVSVTNLKYCCELLKKIGIDGTSRLQSLKVELIILNDDDSSVLPLASSLHDFFWKLILLCDTDCLREVSVCFHSDSVYPASKTPIPPNQGYEITPRTLSPLFLLKYLNEVNVSFQWVNAFASFIVKAEWNNWDKMAVFVKKWDHSSPPIGVENIGTEEIFRVKFTELVTYEFTDSDEFRCGAK